MSYSIAHSSFYAFLFAYICTNGALISWTSSASSCMKCCICDLDLVCRSRLDKYQQLELNPQTNPGGTLVIPRPVHELGWKPLSLYLLVSRVSRYMTILSLFTRIPRWSKIHVLAVFHDYFFFFQVENLKESVYMKKSAS